MTRKAYQVLAAQPFGDTSGGPPSEIELLQVGDWQTPWKGHIVNTVADFQEMVANFSNGAGKFQPDNKLPINVDHTYGEAVGWIYGLEVRGNSLWGTNIEWTPKGQQLLADKEYAYLSSEWSPVWGNPLDEEELVDNVFTGACVTNYPLFSELQPLVASHKQKKNLTRGTEQIMLYMKGSQMNLEELLAKKPEELTDAEKAFIVEHKADLTDEQVTTLTEAGVLEAEGGNDDDDADEDEEDDDDSDDADEDEDEDDAGAAGGQAASKTKKKGVKTISASKLRKLEADAARGVEASEKIKRMEAAATTQTMVISASNKGGKFLAASQEKLTSFYHGLKASQKKEFEALVASLPKMDFAGRQSSPETGNGTGAVVKLEKKIAEDMKASAKDGKPLTYMQSRTKILREDKDLAAEVNQEQREERE